MPSVYELVHTPPADSSWRTPTHGNTPDPRRVAARNSSPTLRDVLQNVAPAFNIPTHAAVLSDLAMRAEALVPSYEYGHTLTNGAGDFDQMLDTMAEYMVTPYTSTQAPFDYAMPEQAAVGWMMGGYARVRGRSAGPCVESPHLHRRPRHHPVAAWRGCPCLPR